MTECIFCTDKLFKSGEVPAALCCGHVFHERCIKTWFRTRQLCPTCKQTPQVSASRRKDGIIRLFLDGAGTASPTKGAAGSGGAYPVDLTDDGGAAVPGAGEEVLLLRHNLLYAQRELDEKKREADALKSTVAGLQGALQVEADTSRSIVSQLRAAQMDLVSQLRAAQMDQRQRENEIRDLKKKMAAESEEVRQARSLRATIDAHELEKEVCIKQTAYICRPRRGHGLRLVWCAGAPRAGHRAAGRKLQQRGADGAAAENAQAPTRAMRQTRRHRQRHAARDPRAQGCRSVHVHTASCSPPERARRYLSPRIPQSACFDIVTHLIPPAQKTSAAGRRSSCWPTTRSFDINLKNPEHPSTIRNKRKLPRASIQAVRRHTANCKSPCAQGRRRTPPHQRLAEPKKESQRSQTREKRPLRLSAVAAELAQCVLAVIPCHPCPPPPTMPRAGVVQGAWCVQCREAP